MRSAALYQSGTEGEAPQAQQLEVSVRTRCHALKGALPSARKGKPLDCSDPFS